MTAGIDQSNNLFGINTIPLTLGGTGGTTKPTAQIGIGVREVLTADRTYFVRTDGSDSNTGLANTAGGAFLTIQKAVNVASGAVDLAGFAVTIQIGDGTYAEAVTLKPCVGGVATLQGNVTTPTNVVINPTSANAITANINIGHMSWKLRSFRVKCTTSGIGIQGAGPVYLDMAGIDFNAAPSGWHILLDRGAQMLASGNFTVSGNATNGFIQVSNGPGLFWTASITITFSNSPSLGTVVTASANAAVALYSVTWTNGGTVTGTRYRVDINASINTNGGGATYIPGSVAGAVFTGGTYN